jgi:hypothetical protein
MPEGNRRKSVRSNLKLKELAVDFVARGTETSRASEAVTVARIYGNLPMISLK